MDGCPRGAQRRGARARRCRSRADLSLFGAEVISSLGNNITHPGGAWLVLVTTGRPGQDQSDRCGDGIGSALAAVFGGPLVDRLGFAAGCPGPRRLPPPTSMTPPRSGLSWRTCRRSVRHPRLWPGAAPRVAAQPPDGRHTVGHDAGQVAEQSRGQAAGRAGPAAPRCPPSAWPLAAPPAASHSCPSFSSAPRTGGHAGEV
jgi:hypothetical protein